MIISGKYSDGIFDVSPEYGFNPSINVLRTLPTEFNELQKLVDNMPVYIDFKNDIKGYLSTEGQLLKAVHDLPNYVDMIPNYSNDKSIIHALYRAYTFIASAYLLEPSYQTYVKTKDYGKALNVLPIQVAQPLCYVSEILNVYPWLDYHYSYCLGNCVKIDESKPATWDNLKMLLRFAGTDDENGFVCIHVDINSYGAQLIKSIHTTINGIQNGELNYVEEGLKLNLETMINMNTRRMEMWKASNHKNYNDFRVFIMGIEGNDEIFGNGVVYEGVEKYNGKPQKFRGQSGSQDDIIPTEDIFTGVYKYYPNNLLTKYLYDMRSYRPQVVQNFFVDLGNDSDGILNKIKILCEKTNDYESIVYLLFVLEQIYKFRNGHWMFVQKFILANTKYARATGGTPITTWLPNQIQACINYMRDITAYLSMVNAHFDEELEQKYITFIGNLDEYQNILNKQMIELGKNDFDATMVFEFNSKFKETS